MKTQLGRLRIMTYYRCSSEFCKGLLDGRGIKGEGDSKTVPQHRHSRVGGKPQGGYVVPVILALRQYPQGGRATRVNKTTPTT